MKLSVPNYGKLSSLDSSIIGDKHMPDSSSQTKWCLAAEEAIRQNVANAYMVLKFDL